MKEESGLLIEINNIKNEDNFKKKKRGITTFEYTAKKYYEEEINKINASNLEYKREEIMKILYKAILEFPSYNYNA